MEKLAFLVQEKLSPYDLEKHLYRLAKTNVSAWKLELTESYEYRKQAQAQHELYYRSRDIWEFTVKATIASKPSVIIPP